jgi:hypothetical protein
VNRFGRTREHETPLMVGAPMKVTASRCNGALTIQSFSLQSAEKTGEDLFPIGRFVNEESEGLTVDRLP